MNYLVLQVIISSLVPGTYLWYIRRTYLVCNNKYQVSSTGTVSSSTCRPTYQYQYPCTVQYKQPNKGSDDGWVGWERRKELFI